LSATPTIDVAVLVDDQKISPFLAKLLVLALLALVADGFDLQSMAFAGPELVKAWHISKQSLGPVLSASLAGLLVSGPIFGWHGDRYGRKAAIVAGSLLYGVFSLATMAVTSPLQLIVLRFLTGIGLGGVIPNIVALIAEYAPRRMRGSLLILVFFGILVGGALPGPVAAWLVPGFGWRVIFFVGGVVPIAVAVLLQLALPESLKFLVLWPERRGEIARLVRQAFPAAAVPLDANFVASEMPTDNAWSPAALFRDGLGVITPLFWVAFTTNLLVNFFVTQWVPTLFRDAGLSPDQVAVMMSGYFVGGIVGSLVMLFLVDRLGMMPIVVLFLLAVPAIGCLGLHGLSVGMLVALSFAGGFCILGNQNSLNAVVGIIYPTACRSKGAGWALGIGRFGSIAGPMLGAQLVAIQMPLTTIFYVPAVPLAIGAVAAVVLLRLCLSRFAGLRLADTAAPGH
jgi:AAHS family 4-hydroxybenzoate transporter-like MFS transporter